jgi:hypothetical protein
MRKHLAAAITAATLVVLALPAGAHATGPAVGANDDKITGGIHYVRYDSGTDATIQLCNDRSPDAFGAYTQNNEPFSVVSPGDPNLILTGWNDYCSGWMGLGFSTDGGGSWTDSLVPGYVGDTSAGGQASPEFGRTNAASDPVAAFDADGTRFYVGAIAYNENAGPKTNSDLFVARYAVKDASDPTYDTYPLEYLGTTRTGRGPAAANFFGIFNDKEMIEVDRAPNSPFEGNVYECWTKFPAYGTPTIRIRASADGGKTFARPVNLSESGAGQGCDIAVEADGDVYVAWRDLALNSSHKNAGLSLARSTDGGLTFSKQHKIATFTPYSPFDGARDCGDGALECPSHFVFHRVPLEPRITSDPTGELPGVFAVFNAIDPSSVEPSDTTYSSAGRGAVGQSLVYVMRSLNEGRTWSAPHAVSPNTVGHQFFADGDALAGRLAVVWQDSRTDTCYSVQLPVGNDENGMRCDPVHGALNTYAAASSDGASFGSAMLASDVAQVNQYEMFGTANIPFLGDYNWIQLTQRQDGSLFGYMAWTDNRDVVPGDDPREDVQDGFDVTGWYEMPDGTLARHVNTGGYDQNIYGNSITIP